MNRRRKIDCLIGKRFEKRYRGIISNNILVITFAFISHKVIKYFLLEIMSISFIREGE